MSPDDEFSVASAQRAADEGRLDAWVVDFLASRGSDNAELAAAFAFSGATYLGPVELELDRLTPLAGPGEDDVVVPVPEDEWESDVDRMERSVQEGWDPPPLLVSCRGGRLLLEDGNHRYEALRRSGAARGWAILAFADATEREAFLAGLTSSSTAAPDATLRSSGGRAVIRFERHLPAPAETVWRAVTDPDEMRSWFPTRVTIDEWKVGATLTHHFDDHDIGDLSGTVVEWDPPHRVRFTWGDDTITFVVGERPGGGTDFVLAEELAANHAARNAAGWDACLDRLAPGAAGESWTERFDRYVARFEPVLGPQDGPPEGVHDLDA